jgi:hypothetical protein
MSPNILKKSHVSTKKIAYLIFFISRARILGKMDYFYFLRHMYETCL